VTWDDLVVVGRVARTHGHRGQVIVNPETDFLEERFAVGRRLFVRRATGIEPMVVTAMRLHQGRPIVALQGIETMNDAEALAGLEFRVPEEELQPLPGGTFYRHDLVGCRVRTTTGQDVGEVTEVEGSLGRSRLVIRRGSGEILVPLVDDICVRVAPREREITIDPPAGLLELNG